jgi:hypothetical protein
MNLEPQQAGNANTQFPLSGQTASPDREGSLFTEPMNVIQPFAYDWRCAVFLFGRCAASFLILATRRSGFGGGLFAVALRMNAKFAP